MNIDINAKLQYFKIGKYGGIHAKQTIIQTLRAHTSA